MTIRAVALSLGSNIEPRLLYLRGGVTRINSFLRVVRLSSVWETEPLDSPADARSYLNLTLAGITALSPEELLLNCQRVERAFGRRSEVRNAPRRLDVDIVWVDGIRRSCDDPVLPHPRFRERAFVLEPLREIGFERFDAQTGRMLRSLSGAGEAVRVSRLW